MFRLVGLLLVGMFLLSPAIAQSPNLPSQEIGLCIAEGNSLLSVANKAIIWGTERLLWEAADKYGIDYDLLHNLAWCESRLQHEDIWGEAGEYGLLQWKLRSWRLYCKRYNLDLNILGLEDQIELTARVLSEGGYDNWANCLLKGRNN